jgi:hypothetical protein
MLYERATCHCGSKICLGFINYLEDPNLARFQRVPQPKVKEKSLLDLSSDDSDSGGSL